VPANGPRAVLFARAPRVAHLNGDPEPQPDELQPFPRLVLVLFARRWPVYIALAAGLFVCEYAVQRFVHFRDALVVGDFLISPLFDATAILIAAKDSGFLSENVPGRLADRAWAVIILEFVISMLRLASEVTLGSGHAGGVFTGTVVLTFVALLIYSPVDACLREDGAPLTILPNALGQSIMLSWRRISRAFGLFALILAVELIELLTFVALGEKHVANAEFWGNVPFGAFATILISVIVTAAYVDLVRTKTVT